MRSVMMRVAEVLAAAPSRKAGYVAAALGSGRVFVEDGEEWVEFTEEAVARLAAVYGGPGGGGAGGCSGCGG
jgi:hypothetical protein